MDTDIQAEIDVLAACLVCERACAVAMEALSVHDFSTPDNHSLFRVILDVGPRMDIALVLTAMREAGTVYRSSPGLMDMMDVGHVTKYNVQTHAERVLEMAKRRRVAAELAEIQRADSSADAKLTRMMRYAIQEGADSAHHATQDVSDVLGGVFADLEAQEATLGIPTGFAGLDAITHGWQAGGRYLLGARPSVGKSTMICRWAWEAARAGHKALVFSVEVSASTWVKVLLSQVAGVNSDTVCHDPRQLSATDWDCIADGFGQIHQPGRLYVSDDAGLTVEKLAARVYAAIAEHQVDVVFVDYLQRMRRPRANSDTRAIGMMSNAICELAQNSNVPHVVACQLNREVEKRDDNKPRLSDLRESGELEQDFDVVAFLWADALETPAQHRGTEEYGVHVGVAKNRFGRRGRVDMAFRPWKREFLEVVDGQYT